MLGTGDRQPLPSRTLQEVYGAGYFHGENSGFAQKGYERVHATWRHWMEFVRAEVGPGARWLDIGCAYGFLVAEAVEAGFCCVGLDASRWAVAQSSRWAPRATRRLACGHAERLPLADGALDVVSAFDLLEHVPDPTAVIAEAARVLRPGGLLLAATPDPLLFDRAEPTHVAERPPSWWVRALERAGFGVALRFFQAPYNCELVARQGGAAPLVAYDSLGAPDPVLRTTGDPALRAALRTGFGPLLDDAARVVSDGAVLYLLNAGQAPLEVTVRMETAEPVALKLQLDGRVVARFAGWESEPAVAAASGSAAAPEARLARLVLAAGGHGLRFAIPRGWARLVRLEVAAGPATCKDLCLTLPFDLYERYALATAVRAAIAPEAQTLLDVGGTIGGDAGHLAWSGDFFPELTVTVADRRPADYPEHVALAAGAGLPFADRAFDIVTALDVLEHVPPAERPSWLEEIWRVTGRALLLGNPFSTPGVAEADRWLLELIRARYGYEHRFLAEHLELGHPDLEETLRFFAARDASVVVLPAGYLPAWVLMQTVNAWLSHPEQDASFADANRAMNRAVGLKGVATPAYRHLLVVDRGAADHTAALAALRPPRAPDLEAVRAVLDSLAGLARGAPFTGAATT